MAAREYQAPEHLAALRAHPLQLGTHKSEPLAGPGRGHIGRAQRGALLVWLLASVEASCKPFCPTRTEDWLVKCLWNGCNDCSECSALQGFCGIFLSLIHI